MLSTFSYTRCDFKNHFYSFCLLERRVTHIEIEEGKSEREDEREILHLQIHSSDAYVRRGRLRLGPVVRNSSCVSGLVVRGPTTSHHLLPPNLHSFRKLG